MTRRFRPLSAVVVLLCLAALPARAGEVAKADLNIIGVSLQVDPKPVATGIDIPAVVQTIFGGKTNAEAPRAASTPAITGAIRASAQPTA